jgi:hypothetical protein
MHLLWSPGPGEEILVITGVPDDHDHLVGGSGNNDTCIGEPLDMFDISCEDIIINP